MGILTWTNHLLAVVSLLVSSVYLYSRHKNYWITLIPGVLLYIIDIVYLLSDKKIGFGMENLTTVWVTSIVFCVVTTFFMLKNSEFIKNRK